MKIKPNWIVFSIAIVAGLVGAFGVNQVMKSNVEQTTILVAARDIPEGRVLTPSDVAVKTVHKDAAMSGGYTSIQQLFGPNRDRQVISRAKIFAGQQILYAAVETTNTSGNTLSFLLREKAETDRARAYTFRATPDMSFGGRIQPDDRVDIIAIFQGGDRSILPDSATKRILTNVPVIDVTGTWVDNSRTRMDVETITVMLNDPREVEFLAMAEYFANRITFAMVPVGARDDTTYGLTRVEFLRALGLEMQPIDINSLLGGVF